MLRVFPGRMWTCALGVLVTAVMAVEGRAQQANPSPVSTIEGTVYDSLLTRGPLKGATVYVVGTIHSATTDARGRFVIDSVATGEQTVTFSHPALDSAGVQAPMLAVRVAVGERSRVAIATPKGATIVKASCPGPRAEQTGLLLGVVRDVDAGSPLAGARVVSRWFEIEIDGSGPRYQALETSAMADPAGVFRLCGVPADIPVLVRAQFGAHESGRVEVYFSGSEVAFRDFAISRVDSAAKITTDSLLPSTTDSAAASVARGSSTVRGVVRDNNGAPVPNARVGLLDGAAATTTNSDGEFALVGIPAGTQTLELRAIGFQPARQSVVLKSNEQTQTNARLDRAAQKLASIRVSGTRKDGRLTKAGFDDRRKSSVGFFLDAEEIAQKSGIYVGDVLRFAPGVTPEYTPKGRIYSMRPLAGGGRCAPAYFLDGMRWYALEGSPILELERYISLSDLAAVEVYRSGAGTPAQFDTGTGCGSVVFWTK